MKEITIHDTIIIDNEIQHGKPVLKGTRLPISRDLGWSPNNAQRQFNLKPLIQILQDLTQITQDPH